MSPENDFALALSGYRPFLERCLLRKKIPARDVPDLVQDILVRAFEKRALYDPTKSLKGWLHRMMRNAASDYWEKAGTQEAASHRLIEDDTSRSNPEKEADDLQIDHLVAGVIDELDPKRRELLRARFVDDLSLQEIADSFDQPLENVKKTIQRTLETCRRALVKKGVTDGRRGLLAPLVWENDNGEGGGEPQNAGEARPRGIKGRLHALRPHLTMGVPYAAAGGLIVYLLMRGLTALHIQPPVTLAPTVEGRSAPIVTAAILHVASHPAPCPQPPPAASPPAPPATPKGLPGIHVDPQMRALVREGHETAERSERKGGATVQQLPTRLAARTDKRAPATTQ